MLRPDVDIAILGGGCAGLSLAVRLAAAGRDLCIIEPRSRYTDDRVWSFWRTAPDPFEDCVRAFWTHWDVCGPGGTVHRGSSEIQYQSIASGLFYDRAQSVLADCSTATLSLGTSASTVRKSAHGWQIETNAGTFSAQHVVDTRPPSRVPPYGQFFLGWEIRTERAFLTLTGCS